MKRSLRKILYILLTVCSFHAIASIGSNSLSPMSKELSVPADKAEEDTIKPRYSVRKTAVETLEDMKQPTADLKSPDNLKTEVTYDEKANKYIIGTKAGEDYVNVPLHLTPEEYAEWSMKKSLEEFYRSKTAEAFTTGDGKDKFNFADMKFDIGPAEKIFGPGGVQIKTQGSAELSFGGRLEKRDNPAVPRTGKKIIWFQTS